MIVVCGLNQAQEQINLHRAQSVMGILSPETQHPTYVGIRPERHLKLSFSDVNEAAEGMTLATHSDAEKLVAFVKAWDREAPLLVHCWAGISRSSAVAFAALCTLKPQEDEYALAQHLRAASRLATPNRLIIQKADDVLNRRGRMMQAVESIGRGLNAYEGIPYILKI
jgi:predicted protein tyrosine phosphatase